MLQSERDRPGSRIAYLDSIRGIAALGVVAYHCWLAADVRQRLGLIGPPHSAASLALEGMAKFFEAGRAAVMLFFVLSGFVLARSLARSGTSYAGYAIKRVLRIYPAFLVVVLVSYALHVGLGPRPHATSVLMDRVFEPDVSPAGLVKTLALWGTSDSVNLDLVVWSLVHEMRISLIFPLILWTVQNGGRRSLAAWSVLSLGCTLGLYAMTGQAAFGFTEATLAETLLVTGYFVVFFACGAYLAIQADRAARLTAGLKPPIQWALIVLSVFIFLKADHGASTLGTCLVDYAHGAAAVAIIALALGVARLERALSHRTLIWLGRISYSLYLVHLPILYVIYVFFADRPWFAGAAIVVLSLAVAEFMARFVEFPFMALGKKLAQRHELGMNRA